MSIDKYCIVFSSSENSILFIVQNDTDHLSVSAGVCLKHKKIKIIYTNQSMLTRGIEQYEYQTKINNPQLKFIQIRPAIRPALRIESDYSNYQLLGLISEFEFQFIVKQTKPYQDYKGGDHTNPQPLFPFISKQHSHSEIK